MTLEEIKSEIRRLIRDIEESVSWFVGDEYTLGEYYTYDKCLKMLEDLESPWHPYPKEKPNRSDHYLVSGIGIVTMYEWSASRESWMNRKSLPISDVGIDAWAELPEPYKEEE